MEKILENKSEKIRKLLEEMERLSEQKWRYKEKYMSLKSVTKTFSCSEKSIKYETPGDKIIPESIVQ